MKKLSSTQIILIGVCVGMLVVLGLIAVTGGFIPKTNPLDAFTVSKTCMFLQVEPPMAFCDDGTQYSVILVNPLAGAQ